jgi:hypothetical protein
VNSKDDLGVNPPKEANLDALAIFGRMVLEEFREAYGDLDGGWLQDTAVKCGLLTPIEVTAETICRKPSDLVSNCNCELGDTCYRLTDAAKAVSVAVSVTSGCHRSHPHEEMNAECERLTEIARRGAQKTAGAQSAGALSSNPMSAVESVSIRTEERPDGATMYHVVARVDQSFAAAVAVRDHISRLVTAPVETTDADRYQAIREFLTVDRDEPGAWTCWLGLACVPFRSQSVNPDDLADMLVRILRERRPVVETSVTKGE